MLGSILKHWRDLRGMSQLDLALEASVSARHLSFIESGRTRPSAAMVLRLSEALALPLRERNALLLAAGYAPRFSESDWSSSSLEAVRAAAKLILHNHEPYPAIVLDSSFNVLEANAAAWSLLGTEATQTAINMVDAVFLPGPIRDSIENWDEIANYFIHRLRQSVRFRGTNSAVAAKLKQALSAPGVKSLIDQPLGTTNTVLLPVVLQSNGETTRWFTTITSFGGAMDALAEEIMIEQFHPA
ncbi:transcriptional regulator [Pelagibacterium lentulum]|uniref:Transcriptional regulator n=1 Tax=Pelagibacterium lentulum TaxID=2029865 RepID=A0A916REZ5_9HYPH|nr:transcriptional regulator [Pelagibacterium lentulum]